MLQPVPVVDEAPLARPPALPQVPAPPARTRGRHAAGWQLSLVSLGLGALALAVAGTARARGAAVIAFRAFTKRFGAHAAVDSLSLEVGRGEVVALLGPNGSGKTTSLKAAAGLIRPTAGEVLLGEPPPAGRGAASRDGPVVPAAAGLVSRGAHRPRGGRVLPRLRRCPGSGRRTCSGSPRSTAPARGWSGPTRAAWCSGSASPSRCCRRRPCCCSTSRPRRSIPTACAPSTGSSSSARPRGGRCSSPRTSSATSSGWPIASPCSWRAARGRAHPARAAATGSPTAA